MAAGRAAAQAAWFRSITQLWHEHGDHGLFEWGAAIEHKTILFGSPAHVRDEVERLLAASGCNYVICSLAWGTLSREQSLLSLRLFADAVMPAFSGSVAESPS